jgi:hypothetical protein
MLYFSLTVGFLVGFQENYMYYKPIIKNPKTKITSFDDALEIAEKWDEVNHDTKPRSTDRYGLGLDKGTLIITSRRSGEVWPVTRFAMTGLLHQLSLPSAIARVFDESRLEAEGSAGVSRAERALEMIGGLMGDLKENVVLRRRGGYLRAVISASDPVVRYADVIRGTQEAFSDLRWKETPRMFREFHITDHTMPLAIARHRVELDDGLRLGHKLVCSEIGAVRPDLYTYVYRLVCRNGLVALEAA